MKILEEDFLVFIVDLDQMRMVDKNILKVDTNGTKNNLLSLFLVNQKKKERTPQTKTYSGSQFEILCLVYLQCWTKYWEQSKETSKIGQDQKSLISTFA